MFGDGVEAIEYLKTNDVDIVLSDIKMNEMSGGLDVAKFIYETKPMTKTVLLSGYKEFDYARKAIDYKVVHYLLKPTNFPMVHEVFKEITKELDIEKEEASVLPMIRDQYLNDLLMGGIYRQEIVEKRGQMLGFEGIMKRECAILIYTIKDFDDFIADEWRYGREQLNTALANLFGSDDYRVKFHPIYNDAGNFYVFVHCIKEEHSAFNDLINQELMKVIINAKNILNVDIEVKSIDISTDFTSFTQKQGLIGKHSFDDDINDKLEVDVETYRRISKMYKLFF